MVITFRDRHPFVGPTMWMLSVQYFIIQFVVASVWSIPFSLKQNTISDLGNTACGTYGSRFVCSPLHGLMNASFIILGVFMTIGSLLIYEEFKKTEGSKIGFIFMGVAGIGTLLVGLFPENTVTAIHILGALMPFLIGNIGIVILGVILDIPKALRVYTQITGIFSLIALFFFIVHHYLGLGLGGMERATAYPQTIWLIVFGIYISKNHFQKLTINLPKHSSHA